MSTVSRNARVVHPAETHCEMTWIVMPGQSNALGTVFGGQVLAWVDICAAVAAQRFTRTDVVTASIDSVSFQSPMRVGEVAVLRAALDQAGVAPGEVGYHEGHGSATPLGDGVEVAGLAEVFARPDGLPPVALGSVKSRLGHLEAAAGLAGVLHALVIARRGLAPAMPHATPVAPALQGLEHALVVPTAPRPLVGRVATICAFGIGGTNAAAVLEAEAAPPEAPSDGVDDGPALLVWSGATPEACDEQERRVRQRLAVEPVAALARASRSGLHDRVRAADWVRPGTPPELDRVSRGEAASDHALVFAAPGQGVGRPGLGRELYEAAPEARAVLDEVFAVADPLLGGSLADRLWSSGESLLDDMPALQVGVSAVSVAWARVLEARGVRPEAVMGHSSGEWAAAVIAGVVSLPEAVRVLIVRGQLLQRAGPGAMWAVFAPENIVRELVEGDVGVAAVNHEAEVVVSGPPAPTEAVARRLEERGYEVRRLPVGVAGHSVLLDPVLSDLEDAVRAVTLKPPQIEFLSTSTGDFLTDGLTDPAYWSSQFRRAVNLRGALQTAREEGLGPVVELGPHPMIARAARVGGMGGLCLGHREQTTEESMARALGSLWVDGACAWPVEPSATVAKPRFGEVPRRLWLEGVSFAASRWERRWSPARLGPPREDVHLIRPPEGDAEHLLAAISAELGALLDAPSTSVIAVLDPHDDAHHAVAGWLRSVRWERPDWGVSIVWASSDDAVDDAQLSRVLPGEELRRIDGRWENLRLETGTSPEGESPWRGHWVITGGFGALGLHTARWLARRGVSEVSLVGRSGCPEGRRAAVDALRRDITVHEVAADVAGDWPEALQQAIDGAEGVVHAAGVLHDAAFWRIDEVERASVLAPKVQGTRRLLQALEARPEVWFVAYSSLTGQAGGAGQSSYGAANAWLDAAVARREGPSLSVAWGPWQGEGLAADTLDRRDAQGLPPMDADEALEALDEAVRSGTRWVAVANLQPDRMAEVLAEHDQPLWRRVVPRASSWDVSGPAWSEHEVAGQPWVSAADQLVWALDRAPSLVGLRWRAPLRVPSAGGRAEWRDHTLSLGGVAGLTGGAAEAPERPSTPPSYDDASGEPVDLEGLYASFRARGVVHGPAYRRVVEARSTAEWVTGRARGGTPGQRLDSLLSLAAVWAEGDRALVPATARAASVVEGWEALEEVVIVRRAGEPLVADVVAMDGEGRPVLWVDALCWAAAGGPTPVPDAAPSPGDAQASPWAGLDEATRHARLRQLVGDACQQVLQVTTLSWDRDLAEQGLDSIVALELRDRLRREGLELPLHRVVGGASPADLVVAAEEQLGPVVATVVTAEAVPVAAPSDASVAEPAIATSDGNDLLQAWWWTPFFLGALVGATLWALIG